MDLAAAVNEEVRDLFAAGADVVQIDEPWLQSRAEKAREFAIPAINRALEGVTGHHRAAHLLRLRPHRPRPPARLPVPRRAGRRAQPTCSPSRPPSRGSTCRCSSRSRDKTVIVGVLDLSDPAAETPEVVAARIEAALQVIPAERLQVGPDCGMKYLSRELAFAKLRALVEGARLVRERLA